MSLIMPTFNPVITLATLEPGKYVSEASTPDEPLLFTVQSTLKPGGISSVVLRFDKSKNNAVTGVDDVLSVYQVIRGRFESFTDTEIKEMNSWIGQVTQLSGALTRLRRGER